MKNPVYTISAPVHVVYPFLSDLKKFGEVHPFIYHVEQLSDADYVCYEKIKILFIPFRFTYKVSMLFRDDKREVRMYSKVRSGVHLQLSFRLTGRGNNTLVEEIIEVKAPPIIKPIFISILKSAHQKFFDTLNQTK